MKNDKDVAFVNRSKEYSSTSGLVPFYTHFMVLVLVNKGNNKITELRTILQRERQNS